MVHTDRIEKAIHTAALFHREQVRKGEDELPYITHLFSVFTILAQYTHDEDILIAGLLHDTIEDTHYTPEDLERDFGTHVRAIVEGVTEKKYNGENKLSWSERKHEYIAGLEAAPEESLYVSAADKIHNFSSILRDYKGKEDKFKSDFNVEDRIKFYSKVVETIIGRLGEENELAQRLLKVFAEYKIFVDSVYTD